LKMEEEVADTFEAFIGVGFKSNERFEVIA
jgi:hypothetical protein